VIATTTKSVSASNFDCLRKQKAEADVASTFQFWIFDLSVLELESEPDLNLPLAEERAVGRGNRAESGCGAGVEIQRRHRMCRRDGDVQDVHRAVYAGDLHAVGYIEDLAQELYVHLLLDVEAA